MADGQPAQSAQPAQPTQPTRLGQRGFIYWQDRAFPAQLRDGQVWVELPFRVDRERLDNLLRKQMYAVEWDHDRRDSMGWGYEYDVEGYYPYWVFPVPGNPGHTILAFAPQDYLEVEGHPHQTGHQGFATYQTSGADEEDPVFYPEDAGGSAGTGEADFEASEMFDPELDLDPWQLAAGGGGDVAEDGGVGQGAGVGARLGGGARVPMVGAAAAREAGRWLPFLWEARRA